VNIVKTFIVILFLSSYTSTNIRAEESQSSPTTSTTLNSSASESKKAGFLKLLNKLKKNSEQGNVLTLNRLGVEYYNGEFVDKNIETSISYFKKSANLNSYYAAYRLGEIYSNDLKQYQEASVWYEKLAKQNVNVDEALQYISAAQYNLAILYETKKLKGGLAKAIHWYKEATINNNASAQFRLGYFYVLGHGVKKDKQKGIHLLEKSAQQGNAQAKRYLPSLK